MKFVDSLTKKEKQKLDNIMKAANNYRTRQRAHWIILSNKKYPIGEISSIYDVHRDTVRKWLENWEQKGFDGLRSSPSPGRPKQKS